MSPALLPRRIAVIAGVALLCLQLAWHGWLQPPERAPAWLSAALFSLPILPGLLLSMLRRRSGVFWLGVASLLYFSHGLAEAWAVPATRALAIAEALLACVVIVAGSWEGMTARFSKGRSSNGNV